MSKTERNDAARQYIVDRLNRARLKNESDFEVLGNYSTISSLLTDLIEVKAMGFRGVVATALTGLHLNSSFDPLNDFYSCNPRSIFENGIFYAYEGVIPCGKSDPLNVAKNQYTLDEGWASGKRPYKAAIAAVNYLKVIVSSTSDRELLVDFYFYRLLRYAEKVRAISIEIPDSDELPQQEIAHRISEFTYRYPESGTIPQYVVSLLLKAIYEQSCLVVEGGDESVFGTNTTSKKPADVWIEKLGQPVNLYEITVKKVDFKRLDDCLQSLNSLGMLDKNVHFICRIPEDTLSLTGYENGTFNYKGKNFNFIDLKAFILSLVSLLTTEQIKDVIEKLTSFIKAVDRPISTKDGWNSIFNL
ncbi:hypothetical protein [Vibrio diazotrophicus]|uniref:hypothetical protein n=1 Tax=Vibrio diazotrophicus TaxID=685 RepID=UPI000C9DE6ED|nr:hypothetical protein [Vibrio diazotrophicus]EKF9175826.1 hypothetical protein [Vibrio cholerae]PNH77623.1 hypothetical protein C1N27_20390 [Vibrio diazotrophicus]